MRRIQLLPLGGVIPAQLNLLGASLAGELGTEYEVLEQLTDLSSAFNSSRGQYSSTDLLARISNRITPGTWRLLGITPFDLYIPILTFVFGEAQLEGPCAIVSTFRLRQEFYGLPPDQALLNLRLRKEAMHELGHTLALTHCDDAECAMASSHAVEWIDIKSSHYCRKCAAAVGSEPAYPAAPF